jgi:hypothetical protein
MEDGTESPRTPHPDPEVEALLQFAPVVRKCVRHDGWLPERQREFITALTILGHAEQAAIAVGGTMSGAYKLRGANGGEGFAKSWDSALALHLRRHPRPEPKGRPSRGEIESGVGRKPWPANDTGPSPSEFESPEAEARAEDELFEKIVRKYWLKVQAERKARLEGRIVAADYYVRQLTYIEIVLEAGGHAHELLKDLKLGGRWVGDIVATPMSLLLDHARRLAWKEGGEPERPPLPPLGDHDDRTAIGEPSNSQYRADRDGDFRAWEARQAERVAVAAEAQRAWEEKARAEAEAWAKREAAKGDEAAGEKSQE